MDFPAYSETLLEHFHRPRNVGSLNKGDPSVGTATVGSLAEGEIIKLQIQVGAGDVIQRACFKAYGSCATIAAASLVTEWLQGKTLAAAAMIVDRQITAALALPPLRVQCSVLAAEAIKAAIDDYAAKRPLPGSA